MGKMCKKRVGGVEVGRIEDGVQCPNGQHKADCTKGDLDWIRGYRGHGKREEDVRSAGDDVSNWPSTKFMLQRASKSKKSKSHARVLLLLRTSTYLL